MRDRYYDFKSEVDAYRFFGLVVRAGITVVWPEYQFTSERGTWWVRVTLFP